MAAATARLQAKKRAPTRVHSGYTCRFFLFVFLVVMIAIFRERRREKSATQSRALFLARRRTQTICCLFDRKMPPRIDVSWRRNCNFRRQRLENADYFQILERLGPICRRVFEITMDDLNHDTDYRKHANADEVSGDFERRLADQVCRSKCTTTRTQSATSSIWRTRNTKRRSESTKPSAKLLIISRALQLEIVTFVYACRLLPCLSL